LWNVTTRVIRAIGHVKIIQNQTVLSSENLDYIIDLNLAQFRGGVVQLQDKSRNTLRTRYLDFNTKDSVAIFQNGGAMRDKDGQIIESRNGTYDSKIKTFTFSDNVNMFTDSVFVKTANIRYTSPNSTAYFGFETNAWKGNDMLSANSGWMNRRTNVFFFTDNVHFMTPAQEGWSDSLYYYRNIEKVEMYGRAQVMDTTKNVGALAGHIVYEDTLSKVTMTREPAVISVVTQKNQKDTVYFGADSLVYEGIYRCDVSDADSAASASRLKDLQTDPVTTYRQKAAADAAKKAADAKKDSQAQGQSPQGRRAPKQAKPKDVEAPESPTPKQESPAPKQEPPKDTVKVMSKADSLDAVKKKAQADSVKVGFLTAVKNVKVFRKDMQVVCDSLNYCDLDSLVRLYKDPVVWNDTVRQYTADSITVVIKNKAMDKASLMSNAFIAIQEDSASAYFDQIKSSEMMAYFDSTGGLRRFDALGGAQAIFYLEENHALATVNIAEAKMLYSVFKNGDLDKVYYFDSPKNDAYPVVQLKKSDSQLKGFKWYPDRRPKDKNDVTPLELRPSQRTMYASRPRTKFDQTDIYFPGYMSKVYKDIARANAAKRAAQIAADNAKQASEDSLRQAAIRSDSLSMAKADSLLNLVPADTLHNAAPADSLHNAVPADSQRQVAPTDTLKQTAPVNIVRDSLSYQHPDSAAAQTGPTPQELAQQEKAAKKAAIEKEKQEEKAAAEKAKAAKQAAREARWDKLDKKDAARVKAKEDAKTAKARALTLKTLHKIEKQDAREQKAFDRYKAHFEKQKARREARLAKKAGK
jgi:hypothetical protein